MNIFTFQDLCIRTLSRAYTAIGRSAFHTFGKGSILYFPSRIHNQKNISIGKNVILQSHIWINAVDQWAGKLYSGHIEIGDNAVIMNNTQISSICSIRIGNGTAIGRNCAIVDHYHDYKFLDTPIVYAPLSEGLPVDIDDGSFLGVNCVVGPGVTIGKHCFIGANSLVTSDIPDYSFAGGVPAKVLRTYCPETEQWLTPEARP